ncbi:TetR/AcrR family transcriptional regulator [Microbacterium oryzae]|uniref:TetR/AcrR family transcriptional regulator n=1 Tax=Microbacterium oryzae TaxID=743009 RepID=A0A6I6E558_9MICO|nr:TetR/AcrR family transcriptional regulator [Microbacterium oryzae]QGU26931.1 TetR/AcrR family transcriptional regulator [Microbacterium oryzae]
METRAAIIARAAELLAQSATGDISTRAVCEAAGITQPVLYRHFGDKDGLLAAVVDAVWDEYLTAKRAARPSEDPVEDLRAGWNAHTDFALAHPQAYRLVFGSALTTRPAAIAEAMALLEGITGRLAAQGRLRMAPSDAARVIMAANSGLALGLILRPEAYPDPAVSALARDAALASILVDAEAAADDAASVAATTLRAHLAGSSSFSPAEAALLDEWLRRIR